MSFTENLYLKRHLKQLHEENLKLKQIINEVYGPGAYPNPNDMRAVDSVDLKPSDLKPMKELKFAPTPTPEELIRKYGKPGEVDLGSLSEADQFDLGAAHYELGLHIPEDLEYTHKHYGAGVQHARAFYFPSTLKDTN